MAHYAFQTNTMLRIGDNSITTFDARTCFSGVFVSLCKVYRKISGKRVHKPRWAESIERWFSHWSCL